MRLAASRLYDVLGRRTEMTEPSGGTFRRDGHPSPLPSDFARNHLFPRSRARARNLDNVRRGTPNRADYVEEESSPRDLRRIRTIARACILEVEERKGRTRVAFSSPAGDDPILRRGRPFLIAPRLHRCNVRREGGSGQEEEEEKEEEGKEGKEEGGQRGPGPQFG